ncbi:MAG TPA: hypothetical protein VEV82_07650, partial [Actinomycetota bacterium]|nr:hypothetical protein [Actinomycetota bacterium]
SATFGGDFGAWSLFADVVGAATTFPGALGRTYCIRVSPHDDAGNSASPSASACTSVPLDDRSFSRSNGWKAKTRAGRYAGTFLESDTQGSSLTLNGVRAKQLALLVTKCRGCGSVQVLWDNVPLAKLGTSNSILGLGSATTKNKELIVLEPLDQLETGTVKVKVTSPHGRPVKIDGLGIAKT